MTHELTIKVDDTVYQTLKSMVEQQTISSLLSEFIQTHNKKRPFPAISSLRGTLHNIDTTDLREETDRYL